MPARSSIPQLRAALDATHRTTCGLAAAQYCRMTAGAGRALRLWVHERLGTRALGRDDLFLVVELEVEEELGDRVVLLGPPWASSGALAASVGGCGSRRLSPALGQTSAWPASRLLRRRGGSLPLPARDRRRRIPSRILLARRRLGGDGLEDGGIGGLGLGSGAGSGADGLAELGHASVTAPTVNSSPCFKTCCPETFLPLTNVPLELPRSRIVSLSETSKTSQWRRLTCDDLMRIKQSSWRPMLVTPSASLRVVEALRPADDLEYVIHRGFVPIAWHVGSHCCRRNDRSFCKLSSRARVSKWKAGTESEYRPFPKTTCIPG